MPPSEVTAYVIQLPSVNVYPPTSQQEAKLQNEPFGGKPHIQVMTGMEKRATHHAITASQIPALGCWGEGHRGSGDTLPDSCTPVCHLYT